MEMAAFLLMTIVRCWLIVTLILLLAGFLWPEALRRIMPRSGGYERIVYVSAFFSSTFIMAEGLKNLFHMVPLQGVQPAGFGEIAMLSDALAYCLAFLATLFVAQLLRQVSSLKNQNRDLSVRLELIKIRAQLRNQPEPKVRGELMRRKERLESLRHKLTLTEDEEREFVILDTLLRSLSLKAG